MYLLIIIIFHVILLFQVSNSIKYDTHDGRIVFSSLIDSDYSRFCHIYGKVLNVTNCSNKSFESTNYNNEIDRYSIFVTICSYDSYNNEYLLKLLSSWNIICENHYSIHIIIQTTTLWTYESYLELNNNYSCNFNIDIDIYPSDVKLLLSEKHRVLIEEVRSDYDLYIYQEDDMLINITHINHYINYSNKFDNNKQYKDYLVGFIRYETLNYETNYYNKDYNISTYHINGGNFIIEQLFTRYKLKCISDEPYLLDIFNPHQALWILTKHQLNYLEYKCNFFNQSHLYLSNRLYVREYMSSLSIFSHDNFLNDFLFIPKNQPNITCSINKLIPFNHLFEFGMHHLRQRYAEVYPFLTIDDLRDSITEFCSNDIVINRHEIPDCWIELFKEFI